MKRQKLIIVIGILLIGGLYIYFRYIYGWLEFRKNVDTPSEFVNHTSTNHAEYTKDSIRISDELMNLLQKHDNFFYNKAYSDSTGLIIDTIIYSPDYNKLAILIITKNSTEKQLAPDNRFRWYYDATCYLGERQNDTITLYWMGPVFTNFYSFQDISHDIREAVFRTLATKKDTGISPYNLNDKRFWNSPVWNKVKEEKIKKDEFQKEKKEHSENIYIPKSSRSQQ